MLPRHLALPTLLAGLLPASAAIIVNDTFDDGTGVDNDPVSGWSPLPFGPEFNSVESPAGSPSSLVLTDIRESSGSGPIVFQSGVSADTSGGTQTIMTVNLDSFDYTAGQGGEMFFGYLNSTFSGFMIANVLVSETDELSFRITAGNPTGAQARYTPSGSISFTPGSSLSVTFTFDSDSFSLSTAGLDTGDVLYSAAAFFSDEDPPVALPGFNPLTDLGPSAAPVIGTSADGNMAGNTATASFGSVTVDGVVAVPEPGISVLLLGSAFLLTRRRRA